MRLLAGYEQGGLRRLGCPCSKSTQAQTQNGLLMYLDMIILYVTSVLEITPVLTQECKWTPSGVLATSAW